MLRQMFFVALDTTCLRTRTHTITPKAQIYSKGEGERKIRNHTVLSSYLKSSTDDDESTNQKKQRKKQKQKKKKNHSEIYILYIHIYICIFQKTHKDERPTQNGDKESKHRVIHC